MHFSTMTPILVLLLAGVAAYAITRPIGHLRRQIGALLVSLALGLVGGVIGGVLHEAAYETALVVSIAAAIVGGLIGMVTDRDITCRGIANGRDVGKLVARDVMTKGIFYCRDSEELDDALRIMETRKIRRLPVIDENKRMVGMLSFGDISHSASRELAGELMAAVSAHHK